MKFETIIFEYKEKYAILTMNRPQAMNALNHQTLREMNEALDDLEAQRDVRGLIIIGAGKSFVAGADIPEIPVGDAEGERRGVIEAQQVMGRISSLEIPTIAAVNGYALGGGNELAMACDIRIASTQATFAQPEVTLGVNACYGGTWRLARLVGPAVAKELLFTARRLSAEEARELGMVNRVVEPDRLMEEAEGMMARICDMAPIAIRYSKIAVDCGLEMSLPQAFAMEREMAALCAVTEDLRLGVEAFHEKKKAVFINR